VEVIVGATELWMIWIDSALGIFEGEPAQNLDGKYDEDNDAHIFKSTYAGKEPVELFFDGSFGSVSFGKVAVPDLSEEFVRNDLSVREGILLGGGTVGLVDLVYISLPERHLEAGDADQDLEFDQLDLVRVQQAAKYLTGQPATWGEGDWDGAPGGEPGNPPTGDGLFDQLDIIAALQPVHYLTGPYAAVFPDAERTNGLSFNTLGQLGANEHIVQGELTAVGSLPDGGDLAEFDLICVPEPSTLVLLGLSLAGAVVMRRRSYLAARLSRVLVLATIGR
jgi:hypothetical protein